MQESFGITFFGKPVPAAQKHTTKTGHKFVPLRQQEALAGIRQTAQLAMHDRPMLQGPLCLTLIAEVPIPISKSKKWQMAASSGSEWPTKRPDLKNLVWLVEDALTTVVFADDSQVCRHITEKRYGTQPKITVKVEPISGPP
jgi:Holliday junction resolvase RusA-like endonuclease